MKEFHTNHPTQLTCSKECSQENREKINKRWLKENREFVNEYKRQNKKGFRRVGRRRNTISECKKMAEICGLDD